MSSAVQFRAWVIALILAVIASCVAWSALAPAPAFAEIPAADPTPTGDPTPTTTPVPRPANPTHHFVFNSLTYNETTSSCANVVIGETQGSAICTLRQAITQANALTSGENVVLITPSDQFHPGDVNRIDFSNVANSSYMCSSSSSACPGATGDGGALYFINKPMTIDMEGRVGIITTSEEPSLVPFYIKGANGVALTRFPELMSSESAIVVDSSANVVLDRICVQQFGLCNHNPSYFNDNTPYVTEFNQWWTERFLTFKGTSTGVALTNSEIGHIYHGGGALYFLNEANVTDLLVENTYFYNEGSTASTCNSGGSAGCVAPVFKNDGSYATLTNPVIRNNRFSGFGSAPTRLPWDLHGSHVTIGGLLFQGNQFLNNGTQTGGSGPNSLLDFSSATVTDSTFKNNTYGTYNDADPAGSMSKTNDSVVSFASATLTDVTFTDETFANFTIGSSNAALNFSGSNLNRVIVKDSVFQQLRIGHTSTSAVLILPYNQVLLGPVTISGNTFVNTIDGTLDGTALYSDQGSMAIRWYGNTTTATWSGMTISENRFAGFTASISLQRTGAVWLDRNLFYRSSGHQGSGIGEAEESVTYNNSVATALMISNDTNANRLIRPWYPTVEDVTFVHRLNCTQSITLQPNTAGNQPNYPAQYTIYWTAGETAERIVASGTLISATPVTVDLPYEAIRDGKIRVQITSPYQYPGTIAAPAGAGESSQLSRWAVVPEMLCITPEFTLTKTAYADDDHTTELEDAAIIVSGTTVYWVYEVTSQTEVDLPFTLRDDQKSADNGIVCSISVPRWGTATCGWSQDIP
jgi:hypothetical protein